jgi:hypothetical protein
MSFFPGQDSKIANSANLSSFLCVFRYIRRILFGFTPKGEREIGLPSGEEAIARLNQSVKFC